MYVCVYCCMIHPVCSVTLQISKSVTTSQNKETCTQDHLKGGENKILNLLKSGNKFGCTMPQFCKHSRNANTLH